MGKLHWPADSQGRPIYPEGFEELAKKLERPFHPPGRDVRCIVSVGMLTEGWDCNTVTHIIGLRPFMSQLLCEQVVGRGLRRRSYDVGNEGKLSEEVAKVFGVPFEVIPFKANTQAAPVPPVHRHHVHAIPAKAEFEIHFPRVEGYTQAIRNRVTVHWANVATLVLDPAKIPPEVEAKGLNVNNQGRLSLSGPGRIDNVTLNEEIRPDVSQGEAPEVPRYESSRGPGSTAEVDFWTSRAVREVTHCHLNYIVADTDRWEQSAAFYIDRHPAVLAFVKNAGLGFAIPYLHNGQMHDYVPDFLIRLRADNPHCLILETKGFDPLEEVKRSAAERWTAAVNADGTHGRWTFAMAKKVSEVPGLIAGSIGN